MRRRVIGSGCKGCIYRSVHLDTYLCNYLLITGHSRGCPIEGCTRKETCKHPASDQKDPGKHMSPVKRHVSQRINAEKALALYKEGKTDREIAETFGVTKSSVTQWRKRRGLPAKISRGRKWT